VKTQLLFRLVVSLLVSGVSFGAMAAVDGVPRTLLGAAPPYVPREVDYSPELGVITTGEELFWFGGNIGVHVGHCMFSQSETCQQYVELIGGAGVREAETHGLFLGSLRWQYVNFPDRYSPFWRLFSGASLLARGGERGWRGVGGVGVGVTTYLHKNVDLRLEFRAGLEDRPFAQGLIAAQIKVDRLLEYFALKLKDFGMGAVGTVLDATGTAVKATGEGLGGIVEGVSSQFREGDSSQKKDPAEKSAPDSVPAKGQH
jgi:hypothetical protein